MKKVILLFILFMLPSTSVFAASSVVAIKEKEIENEELLFLRFDKDHQLSLVRRENKGEESIILTNLLTTNFEVYGHLNSYQILNVKY